MQDGRFDLGVARQHSGARALVRARLMVNSLVLLSTIAFVVVGAALIIGLFGSDWQTDAIHLTLLSVGAATLAVGAWFTAMVLRTRPPEFPSTMSLSSVGVVFQYPDGRSSTLAWADPGFELELREVRPPAFRADGPMLNIEWNEKVEGQPVPRHIHGIVSREAFTALETEVTNRGFNRVRVVSETPPMVSFIFRPVAASRDNSHAS